MVYICLKCPLHLRRLGTPDGCITFFLSRASWLALHHAILPCARLLWTFTRRFRYVSVMSVTHAVSIPYSAVSPMSYIPRWGSAVEIVLF